MSLYGDSINLLSGLGKPRSRNFHGSKEVSSLFDKKENGRRKRSKTFHVYKTVEGSGSLGEEHRIPLMEKNINTHISKVSEPYKESYDNSDQIGDLLDLSAPNFDTVDTIQSQMSLVRITNEDDDYPENDQHNIHDTSSPNMRQTNQNYRPSSQDTILAEVCNINSSQKSDLRSRPQLILSRNSPEMSIDSNSPEVALNYNYPERNLNYKSQVAYHQTIVPSKDVDDDVILVDNQPQANISISSFYDAVADSEEELEPLSSSSQYLDPSSNLTTIPSNIRTIEPSQYYEENVEDYGTQYSNANFQGEDMSANCNSTHSLDGQAYSQTFQEGGETSREFGEYIISHNLEETDDINVDDIKDKLNCLSLPTKSKLSKDANHPSVSKELLPDSLHNISKITKILTESKVTSDEILDDVEPEIQPIVADSIPLFNPPSNQTTERSNVKQSFRTPICKKRTSTLADICSKTNGVKLSTRVGLSKRAKIDSLHSYLNRS